MKLSQKNKKHCTKCLKANLKKIDENLNIKVGNQFWMSEGDKRN